jgi:hypothetical protein
MGVGDILRSLEEKGEIEKVVFNDKFCFSITNKSKILAEVQGNFFRANFRNIMFENKIQLLEEFKTEKSTVDPILKFIGFYVVGSLIESDFSEDEYLSDKKLNKEKKEELRQIWLSSVLDLQKGLSFSDFFDDYFNHNKKDILILVKQLGKTYKTNMFVFGKVLKNIAENYPKIKKLSDDTFDKTAIDELKNSRK